MHGFKIRKAKLSDADIISKLEIDIFKNSAWSVNNILYEIRNNSNNIFVVEENNQGIIGYIFIRIIKPEAHILNIAVAKDYRRIGVGTELFEFGIDYIKKKGCKEVFLEVKENNTAAKRLYEKFGFKKIGIRKKYYADNENALIYAVYL